MPPIPRNQIKGRRFGLLADTHDNKVAWPETLQRIRTALGTVDGIIHCGDLCTRQALDDLAGITQCGLLEVAWTRWSLCRNWSKARGFFKSEMCGSA